MELKFKFYSRMKDSKTINHHLRITLLLHRYYGPSKTYPIKIKNRFEMRIRYTHTHFEENMMSKDSRIIPKTSLFFKMYL